MGAVAHMIKSFPDGVPENVRDALRTLWLRELEDERAQPRVGTRSANERLWGLLEEAATVFDLYAPKPAEDREQS